MNNQPVALILTQPRNAIRERGGGSGTENENMLKVKRSGTENDTGFFTYFVLTQQTGIP